MQSNFFLDKYKYCTKYEGISQEVQKSITHSVKDLWATKNKAKVKNILKSQRVKN
jgi:hypothetical protein